VSCAKLLALACACLSLAAVPAGCSGGADTAASGPPLTKAEYQTTLSRIFASVKARYGNLSVDPATIPSSELAGVEKGLRELADQLDLVSPPAEVGGLHADYIAGLRGFADELPDLTAKLKAAKDPAAALDVLLGSEPLQLLLRASQDFSEKSYQIDLDGREE